MSERSGAKVVSRAYLPALCQEQHAGGKKIVLTNGCFDLLHLGHVRYLQAARDLGDVLIVGLNSDASTRRLKGPGRPLVPEEERAEVLAALACVDYVTIFEEDTAVAVVQAVRPDVYVKGGDYAGDTRQSETSASFYARLPEAAPVLAAGGQVRLLPYLPGHSTSDLIQRILQRYSHQAEG